MVSLLTSEVMTNALRHCDSGVEVVVGLVDGSVRVEVWDEAGDVVPIMQHSRTDDEHGRGLHLVDSLASDWGVVRSGPKKAVWFELASNCPSR